jgi:hypothetical protein
MSFPTQICRIRHFIGSTQGVWEEAGESQVRQVGQMAKVRVFRLGDGFGEDKIAGALSSLSAGREHQQCNESSRQASSRGRRVGKRAASKECRVSQ